MIFGEKKVYTNLRLLYDNSTDVFFVCGDKGCGKSYVVNHFLSNIDDIKIVNCRMSRYNSTNEYTPFKNGISEHNVAIIKPTINKLIDSISSSDIKLSILIKFLTFIRDTHNQVKDNMLSIFSQPEMDIVSKINFLATKEKTAFVFDNIFEWDYNSLSLLAKIIDCKLHRNMFNNAIFIITTITKDNINFKDNENSFGVVEFDNLDYDKITTGELSELLNNNIECSVLDRIKPIIKVCGNDLELLKRIINDILTCGHLADEHQTNGRLDVIKELLSSKLRELGAEGKQINDVLEYASILGMHFSVFELEKVIDTSKDELLNIIRKATNLYFINDSDPTEKESNKYYSFAHEFIRKVFENGITKNRIHVYEKLSQAISEVTPYDYLRRARYNIQANNFSAAESLYILYFFQQIRTYEKIPIEILKEFKGFYNDNEMAIKQVEQYKEGVRLYNEKKYTDAYNIFSSINRLTTIDVIVELDIMISMCLTKQLDAHLRNEAVAILEDHLNKKTDISVKERLQIRLIITYAHVNETLKARKLDKSLCESFASRRLYDKNAIIQYMRLQRIANSYYDCEISLMKMKQAVDYFGPYKSILPLNIIQYFLACVNYAGALCMCGKFEDSFEVSCQVFDLQSQYSDICFPRMHININNYIVSGFLSDNFTENEALEQYLALMKIVPYSAERMFFISNLSVFYSLCGKHQEAYNIITAEANRQNINQDPEKIYNYRYCTNASVYKFMMGKRDEAIKILEECPAINDNIPDSIYMRKKLELMRSIFSNKTPYKGTDFLYAIKEKNCNETAEKYYLMGYTFTTLYNWDI